MGSAHGKVFVELHFVGFLSFLTIACSAETKRVWFHRGAFNVTNLDGEIKRVLLGFERAEQSEDVTDLVRLESTFGVLDLEDTEVVILLIELF